MPYGANSKADPANLPFFSIFLENQGGWTRVRRIFNSFPGTWMIWCGWLHSLEPVQSPERWFKGKGCRGNGGGVWPYRNRWTGERGKTGAADLSEVFPKSFMFRLCLLWHCLEAKPRVDPGAVSPVISVLSIFVYRVYMLLFFSKRPYNGKLCLQNNVLTWRESCYFEAPVSIQYPYSSFSCCSLSPFCRCI